MQHKRKIWFFSSIMVTLAVVYLLVTGSSVLTIALDKANTIPLGTFVTWAGMIALPLSIYWGTKKLRKPTTKLDFFLGKLLSVIILMAIVWVPVSWLLAGNLSFSFSEKETFQGGQAAMKLFWGYSYGIGIGALLVLFTFWISLLFRSKTKKSK